MFFIYTPNINTIGENQKNIPVVGNNSTFDYMNKDQHVNNKSVEVNSVNVNGNQKICDKVNEEILNNENLNKIIIKKKDDDISVKRKRSPLSNSTKKNKN